MICECGHSRSDHPRDGACWLPSWLDMPRCECVLFHDPTAVGPGERLEFGRHRIPAKDAETAPAWPSLAKFGAMVRRRSLGR